MDTRTLLLEGDLRNDLFQAVNASMGDPFEDAPWTKLRMPITLALQPIVELIKAELRKE